MQIVSALFVESFNLREAPGPSTRIDLSGVFFSIAAPGPVPVTLEPHQKTWLFGLDAPASLPSGAYALADLELRDRRPVAERKRYEMSSYLDFRYGEHLPAFARQGSLRFDPARQLIAAQCSGALILAKLGLLAGGPA